MVLNIYYYSNVRKRIKLYSTLLMFIYIYFLILFLTQGLPGLNGLPGKDAICFNGTDGKPGEMGPIGPPGPPGPRG